MDKNSILLAIKNGNCVCHGNTKNIVKVNNRGIIFATDFRTNKPYELTNKGHFEDCFLKGAK